MPPKRKSVAALRASGSRHYTKEELAARERAEIKVPDDYRRAIVSPAYLTGTLVDEFNELAPTLEAMGVLTHLDVDTLAQFLIARKNYIRTTNKLTAAINAGISHDADRWSAMQDRFLKQMRAAAVDLGLTVTSRCNLHIKPVEPQSECDEEDDLFGDS